MTVISTPEVNIAIDGGAYQPGNIVTNGTERHLQQLLLQIEKDQDKKIIWRYYCFNVKNKMSSLLPHIAGFEGAGNNSKLLICCLPKFGYGSFWLPLFCLIHRINTFIGYSTYIPLLLSTFRIQTISVIHDFGFIDFPYKYNNVNRLHTILIKALQRADKFICFSKFVRARLKMMTKKPIDLVYSGMEHLKNIKYQISNIKIKNKYLIHVGRLVRSKNIEEIFKIYISVRQKKNIDLVLVGVDDGYKNILEKNLIFMNNRYSIHFVKKITDEELSDYYKKALAVINTSLTEGLCFPVLEALSMGKTVFVKDKKLFYEYKNSFNNIHLIESILDVINNNIRKTSKHKSGKYSWDTYFKTIKNICLK
jgi:glycosyltransferase involved in cell wall biosynthesis